MSERWTFEGKTYEYDMYAVICVAALSGKESSKINFNDNPDDDYCTRVGMTTDKCHAYNHGHCMNGIRCQPEGKESA